MKRRGPAIVFVADAGQWQRVRHLIWSIREQQGVSREAAELVCVDIGLDPRQHARLQEAGVRCVKTIRGTPDAMKMPQPFMHKAFADLYWPLGDPLIVCDTDLEFRAPGVLAELLELARRKLFIAEEVFGWVSNLNVRFELDDHSRVHGPLARTFLAPQADLLEGPIYNAGLFGGPRGAFDQFMRLGREMMAGTFGVYHWFWEQAAYSKIVRMGLFDVEILTTEHNWITSWGDNPAARILHFSGDVACTHALRTQIPADYLRLPPGPVDTRSMAGCDVVMGERAHVG